MVDVTVKQLAHVVGIPVERLLTQLQEAGLSITDETQTVNEDQKQLLLMVKPLLQQLCIARQLAQFLCQH